MKKLATMKRLALQIEYHMDLEESYPVFITRHFYEEVYHDKPNIRKHVVHHRYVLFILLTGMCRGSESEFEAFVFLTDQDSSIHLLEQSKIAKKENVGNCAVLRQ